MAPKSSSPTGLKVSPDQMMASLRVLQDYVNERAAMVEQNRLTNSQTAVKLLAAIQDFTKAVNDMAKAPAEALYNTLRFTVIPQLFDNDDITAISVDGVGKCRLQDDITCEIANKPGLNLWLTANELEDIIVETVNAQTLAAQMRARMRQNAETVKQAMKAGTTDPDEINKLLMAMPPADVVKITPVVRAQLTRE